MGHVAKARDIHGDVLDELEAAIKLGCGIRVRMEDGSHRAGLPLDLYTENHEDYLTIVNHLPIAVSTITRVERL